MTENKAVEKIRKQICNEKGTQRYCRDNCMHGMEHCAYSMAIQALTDIQAYRAIGTVEEFKALKEKNTPMELAEHNFQDEPHHYLCPVCRNIVNLNQDYCEECGQALET